MTSTIELASTCQEQFYADYDNTIARACPHYFENLRRLVESIPQEARSIVELGSGTGNLTQLLAQAHPSANITGIEYNPELVELAQKKGIRADFLLGDITKDDIFQGDVIVSALTLHNIKERESVYENILASCSTFIHYDHFITPGDTLSLIYAHLEKHFRSNGFCDEEITHGIAHMVQEDHPMRLEEEIALFDSNDWILEGSPHVERGFAVYKVSKT